MTDKKEAKPNALQAAHDASIVWRYIAPRGHTLDDCRQPSYWRNVLREVGQQRIANVHAYNRIEILADDNSWEAELRVTSVNDGLVHTRLLREWVEPAKPGRKAAVPEGYIVEHIAGNGWRAISPAGDILIEKQTTEDHAMRAAINHSRKRDAA